MKKARLIGLNLVAALVLVRFTISKFAAWPISVAGFVDMARPLGIDPALFRIGTGFVIGFAALSHAVNALIVVRKETTKATPLLTLNILYSTGAMTGALLAEFFLRSAVKWPLVFIALGIIGVSVATFRAFSDQIVQLVQMRMAGHNPSDSTAVPTSP